MSLKSFQITLLLTGLILMPVSHAATTKIFCSTPSKTIPNDDATGVSDTLNITDTGLITNLKVTGFGVTHEHIGELTATLTHSTTGTSIKLIELAGNLPGPKYPCYGQNISDMTFDDAATLTAEDNCGDSNPAYTAFSAYRPNEPLSGFVNQDVGGDWTLAINDTHNHSTMDGILVEWCLEYTRPNTAVVTFSPPSGSTLSFGDTAYIATTQTLQATNTGGDDLLITEVSLVNDNANDFSIVTPNSPVPPTVTVKAGEIFTVKVQCLPKGPGLRTGTLTIKTNLDALPVLTYPLTCNGLVSQLAWDSSNGNPVNFGDVAIGASISKTLTLKETGGITDLNLTTIAISGTHASDFAVDPTTMTVGKGTSGTLTVQCTPTAGGLRQANLTFKTNDPSQPTLSYALRCTGVGLSTTPAPGSALAFGTAAIGATATQAIVVKNSGSTDLVLSNATFDSAGFSLSPDITSTSITIAPSGKSTLNVQCNTSSLATYSGVTVAFNTNIPSQPTISYKLNCTVTDIPTPLYGSSPSPNDPTLPNSPISFGKVDVGSEVTKTLTVIESGNAPLKVSNPVLTGSHPGDFRIDSPSLPFIINDGGTAVPLMLKCAPTGRGTRTATLQLTATGIDGTPVTNQPNPTYSLTCTGKAPGYSSTPDSPGSTIDVGSIAIKQTRTYSLSVGENGNAPLTVDFDSISGVQANDFTIDTATTTFPFTINDGGTARTVKILCRPTGLGVRTAELRLKSNDILANPTPTYTLKCTGLEAIGPAYSSSPVIPGGTLDFGSAAVGQTVTQTLTVAEVGSSVLNVAKGSPLIDGTHAGDFSLDSGATSPFAGKNYFDIPNGTAAKTVTVSCTPTAVGLRVATLNLSSTDTDNPKPSYTLQCQGTPSLIPGYSSTPVMPEETLDFGSGPVNIAISKTLTLAETGNADLEVDLTVIAGTHAADFQVTSPTFPITLSDGGSTQTVTVVCTPGGEGARTGLLKLTSNDPVYPAPTYPLNCTGTVVATPIPPVTGETTPIITPVTPSGDSQTTNPAATTTPTADSLTTPAATPDGTGTPAANSSDNNNNNTAANVPVTVVLTGNGSGTVTSTPAGIHCTSDKSSCTATYPVDTTVTLTPQAAGGSQFSHWEPTCPDGHIVLKQAMTCTAYFNLELRTLTVSTVGNGTISSVPSGLFCGAGHNSCAHNFTAGDTVGLVALPQSGWQFSHWAGECTTGNVLMNTDKTCQAVFTSFPVDSPNTSVVTAAVQIIGNGTVTSDPAAIECGTGATCVTQLMATTVITLTATPVSGNTFVGWSGTCSGIQTTVAVTADKLTNCQAIFTVVGTTVVPVVPTAPVVVTPDTPVATVTTPVDRPDTTAAPVTPAADSTSLPRCPTHGDINLACDAQWDEVSEIIITPRGYLSNGILVDTLENHGWVSNLKIQPGAKLSGGVVSGTIENAGTMSDFEFRGLLLEGGTLAGKINNTSRVSGTLKNVQLAAGTTVSGGKLSGDLQGHAAEPAFLDNLVITAGSRLDNVIIGTDVKWAADVIFGENVQFVHISVADPVAAANADDTTDAVTYLDPHLYISDKLLQGDIRGHIDAPAFLENVTLLANSTLSHVIIGQNVKNQGTIVDFEFRGAWLQGGTLGGVVKNTQAGTFQDVQLAPNTVIYGGNLQGHIIGDPAAPAKLEEVRVAAGSYLENVIIGRGTQLPKDVTLGEGVQFVETPAADNTVTVPPASALEITPQGQTVNSPAQFDGQLSVCGDVQADEPLLSRREAKNLDVSTTVTVDPKHLNQPANLFVVARQRLGKTQQDYMRVGEQWQVWDSDLSHLKAAQVVDKLPATPLELPLFKGDLSSIRGELSVYVGYQLPDRTLVYDGVKPLHFSIDSSPDSCIVYALHDGGLNDSQFLKFNLSAGLDGEMQALGPVYPGYDIEGLTVDPNNPDVLYATAGNDAENGGKGYVYTVNRKTGVLKPVGPTGYQQVSGLATHPIEQTLWGWAINYIEGNDKKGVKWMGIITLDPKTGRGTPVKQVPPAPIEHDIGGLAWLHDGSKLYAAGGDVLWAYDPETQVFAKACVVPEAKNGDIEGLDMQPNGLLLMGIDYQTNNNTTIVAYDPKRCQIVNIKTFKHSSFNDIESIIWPAAECNDLSWLNEEACH